MYLPPAADVRGRSGTDHGSTDAREFRNKFGQNPRRGGLYRVNGETDSPIERMFDSGERDPLEQTFEIEQVFGFGV